MIFRSSSKFTRDEISKFANWLRKIIRQDIKFGKPGPKNKYMSTMDLDVNNKLYLDYLGRRKARRKAKKAEKEFHAGQVGGLVYGDNDDNEGFRGYGDWIRNSKWDGYKDD